MDNTVLQVDPWYPIQDVDPKELKEVFGTNVLSRRYVKLSTPTPNPIAPTCISDVYFLLYENKRESLKWQSMSYAPDQYLSDTFKFWDNWEVLTSSPDSEEVVVRMSYRVEWVDKPWLLGG